LKEEKKSLINSIYCVILSFTFSVVENLPRNAVKSVAARKVADVCNKLFLIFWSFLLLFSPLLVCFYTHHTRQVWRAFIALAMQPV
jgi:hypothetical protein